MQINPIEMTIESRSGTEKRSFPIGSVSGVRFSSRDVEGLRKELDEMLERDGHFTMATRTNPSIFRLGRYLLTQSAEFEVQGPLTGGEAEVVAIRDGDEVFISVGSDQCDRELDLLFPDKPKQMCPHPIAATAWPYSEVRDHWDSLQIYSHVVVGGHTVPLQDCPLSALVDLEYLLAMDAVKHLPDVMFLYCGSSPFLHSAAEMVAQHGLPEETTMGIGEAFLVRLHDPVLDRTIEHQFSAVPLGDDLAERRDIPGTAVYPPSK
ncbi:MAG: DUF2848 family protein [Candidatus Poribacteria bacterium]|nr:DUF2848 family protein [Candidatus Poribacteria bacterium]